MRAQRGLPIADPAAIFHSQVMVRFLYMFGMAPDTRGFSHIKILILAAYAAGVLGVILNRDLRARTGIRSLLLVSSVTLLAMIALDREAQRHYLVHFVVWMISLTAVAAVWWWDRRSLPRWALSAALALVVLVQAVTIGNRVMQRPYFTAYLPVTAYLKRHARGNGTIMGSSRAGLSTGLRGLPGG